MYVKTDRQTESQSVGIDRQTSQTVTVKQADSQAGSQSVRRTVRQSDRQTVRPMNEDIS